jgi:hypothetical protein
MVAKNADIKKILAGRIAAPAHLAAIELNSKSLTPRI